MGTRLGTTSFTNVKKKNNKTNFIIKTFIKEIKWNDLFIVKINTNYDTTTEIDGSRIRPKPEG